jgi:hypothetical protein
MLPVSFSFCLSEQFVTIGEFWPTLVQQFNQPSVGEKLQLVMTCCESLCHLDHIEESVCLIYGFKIIKNSNFEQFVSETGLFKITSRERWFI